MRCAASKGVSLRVLLDVAELGPSSYTGNGGVRRATENIVRRLALRPELTIGFTGLGPLVGRTVTDSLGIANKRFHSRSNAALERLAASARRFSPKMRKHDLISRITRRTFSAATLLEQRFAETIPTPALADAQLIHSFYRALPRNVQRRRRIAKVVTIYDLIPIRQAQLASPHFALALRDILETITPDTWVLCISQWVKDDFCAYSGHPSDRVTVMPLAATPEVFHPSPEAEAHAVRARYGLPDRPYILSLGALDERKNTRFLINAFRRLIESENVRDLHLVLVGSEVGAGVLRREISESDPILNQIIFTGRVPDAHLSAVYSGAAAFAFPSLAEGFGLPVLEAMQCGTPVISSNTSALPEVVGSAGVLLGTSDVDAWVDAMFRLVTDTSLRQELGEAALMRAASFSWDRTVESLVDAYGRAVAEL